MTPTPQKLPVRIPSVLPTVALVFSGVGLCLPPLLVVGVILGVVALAQSKGSLGVAIAAVCVPVLYIPIVGMLAAIAIPNFIKFQARSKQVEAKSNLKVAYRAQKEFQADKDRFDVHPLVVGFVPERGNRYLYLFSQNGPIAAHPGEVTAESVGIGLDTRKFPAASNAAAREAIPAALAETVGISRECPDCDITLVAAGNVDNDDTIDVWSISTRDRPGAKAGIPFNDVDDTAE